MAAQRKESEFPSAAEGDSSAPTSPTGEVAERAGGPARKPRTSALTRRRRAIREPEDLHGVAALIVAHNQARRIAATVRAARAIPGIDLVLVVDDASTDNTQELARKAGAVVVRHSHHRGRAASVETGASVIGMRDEAGREPRAVLLLPGGLGQHAVGAAPLVPAVTEHVADLAIALTAGSVPAGSASVKAARRAVERASGWLPAEPLSAIRCMTREALEAAIPLARGAGMDVGMTIDVLNAGLTATEVECDIRHRGGKGRTATVRASQYRDVMMAVGARALRDRAQATRAFAGPRPADPKRRDQKDPNVSAPVGDDEVANVDDVVTKEDTRE